MGKSARSFGKRSLLRVRAKIFGNLYHGEKGKMEGGEVGGKLDPQDLLDTMMAHANYGP